MTPIALVSYGPGSTDVGLLVDEDGHLVALWPDGHADPVERDGDGYRHEHGVQLPVVSTGAAEMARALADWRAIDGDPSPCTAENRPWSQI